MLPIRGFRRTKCRLEASLFGCFDTRWSRSWQRFLLFGWKQKDGLHKKSCRRAPPA
jgi:hypothetical protein